MKKTKILSTMLVLMGLVMILSSVTFAALSGSQGVSFDQPSNCSIVLSNTAIVDFGTVAAGVASVQNGATDVIVATNGKWLVNIAGSKFTSVDTTYEVPADRLSFQVAGDTGWTNLSETNAALKNGDPNLDASAIQFTMNYSLTTDVVDISADDYTGSVTYTVANV